VLLLRVGDEGAPVAAVQQALAAGGADVPIDGVFAAKTDAAVRAFQSRKGLRVDGVVGNRTIAALGLDWVTVDPAGFRAAIVRIAEREWARWHVNGTRLVETDPVMTSVLQGYYRTGVDRDVDAVNLQNAQWQREHPWSAVFISYVMRSAGAGRRFAYSAAHQRYIAAAKANRLGAHAANPMWAFSIDELRPEVGDLVCKGRENSGATYENIDVGPRQCHADIVVAVDGSSLQAIGGNVAHAVGRKVLRTSGGFVDLGTAGQHEYFAVIRVQEEEP
jgi:hypothetical protein